jgi:hypothetical protein
MTYKKNLIILLSIISALALLYTGSIIFDATRSGARASSYVWLDPNLSSGVTRIAFSFVLDDDEDAERETVELIKKAGQWFVACAGTEFPARQLRIEDFISSLSVRGSYPVRSTSASSHERMGFGNDAPRLTIYSGNTMVLDILVGGDDIFGKEVYIRKYGQNEVRSGDIKFMSFITDPLPNWYNLRLIPESEDGRIDIDSIQRVSVYDEETQIFTRRNKNWVISGVEVNNPNQSAINSYIRSILNLEGTEFVQEISLDDFDFRHIVMEFGNGSIKTIRVSEANEFGRCVAHVVGSQFIYSIQEWTAERLFRFAEEFEM